MPTTRSMNRDEKLRLAEVPRSPSPPVASETGRPANWRPEDDKPELHHIPLRYGVPVDDFNWDWYYAKMEKEKHNAEVRRSKKESEQAMCLLSVVVGGLILVAMSFLH